MTTSATPATAPAWSAAYAAAWSSHDIDQLLAFFTDDIVYEDVPMGVVNRGKDELRAFLQALYNAIPDFTITPVSAQVAEGSAALEWVMAGTQTGDLGGLPGTGKRSEIRGSSIMQLAGDKIRRNADYWDIATLLRQVGLLPAPDQAPA